MQFPESWLRTFVDPQLTTDELSHALTMAGLEVEDLRPAAPPTSKIVVGQVLEVVKHPDADKLNVPSREKLPETVSDTLGETDMVLEMLRETDIVVDMLDVTESVLDMEVDCDKVSVRDAERLAVAELEGERVNVGVEVFVLRPQPTLPLYRGNLASTLHVNRTATATKAAALIHFSIVLTFCKKQT